MPPKIKRLWVVCILIILFGFIYISVQEQVEQAVEKEAARASRPVPGKAEPVKPQREDGGETFKIDLLKEIKELNAMGKYQEAVAMAEGAASLNPDNPRLFTWWGISLVKAGKREDAIEKFVRAAELDATYAKTFLYWGLTLGMEGKAEAAIGKYKKVLELDPDNSNAYAYWGAALGQMNRHAEAVKKLQRALEINPLNSNVFGVLIDSLYRLKRYREAWDRVKQAREAKAPLTEISLNRLREAFPEPAEP